MIKAATHDRYSADMARRSFWAAVTANSRFLSKGTQLGVNEGEKKNAHELQVGQMMLNSNQYINDLNSNQCHIIHIASSHYFWVAGEVSLFTSAALGIPSATYEYQMTPKDIEPVGTFIF